MYSFLDANHHGYYSFPEIVHSQDNYSCLGFNYKITCNQIYPTINITYSYLNFNTLLEHRTLMKL